MENRLKFTESEKLAMRLDNDRVMFMGDGKDLNSLIEKENAMKFNSQLEKFEQDMEDHNAQVVKDQESLGYDISQAEIKALFSRILVKPFAHNPFQQMKVENGIIIDAGGYTPHQELNPITGKYEEQKEFIISGVVVDAGPECKYLKEGDVIYYRRDTAVPVPFLKQGLISIAENQVIAAVGLGLSARFESNGK